MTPLFIIVLFSELESVKSSACNNSTVLVSFPYGGSGSVGVFPPTATVSLVTVLISTGA